MVARAGQTLNLTLIVCVVSRGLGKTRRVVWACMHLYKYVQQNHCQHAGSRRRARRRWRLVQAADRIGPPAPGWRDRARWCWLAGLHQPCRRLPWRGMMLRSAGHTEYMSSSTAVGKRAANARHRHHRERDSSGRWGVPCTVLGATGTWGHRDVGPQGLTVGPQVLRAPGPPAPLDDRSHDGLPSHVAGQSAPSHGRQDIVL